jgi:hypothetical protein
VSGDHEDPHSDTDSNPSELDEEQVAIGVEESRRWSRVSTTLLLTFRDASLEQQYSQSLPKLNNISPSQNRRKGCAVALGLFSLLSVWFMTRILVSPRVDRSSAITAANYVSIAVMPVAAVALIRVVLYENDPSKYLSRMHVASAFVFNLHSIAVVCFWGLVSTTITTDAGLPGYYSDPASGSTLYFDHVALGSGSHAYQFCLVAATATSVIGATGYFSLFKPLFSSALVYSGLQVGSQILFSGPLTGWFSTSDLYISVMCIAMLAVSHVFMLISIYHSERWTRDMFLHGCALQAALREEARRALLDEQDERKKQDNEAQRTVEDVRQDREDAHACTACAACAAREVQLREQFDREEVVALLERGAVGDRPREGDEAGAAETTLKARLHAAEQELWKEKAERKALTILLASVGPRVDTTIDCATLCGEIQNKFAPRVKVDKGQSMACYSDPQLQVSGTMSLWRQAVSQMVDSALDTDIDGKSSITLKITDNEDHVRVEVGPLGREPNPDSFATDPSALRSDMLVAQHLVRALGSELYVEASSPPLQEGQYVGLTFVPWDGRGDCSRAFFSYPRLTVLSPPPTALAAAALAAAPGHRPRARTRRRHEPRLPTQTAACMGGTGESGDVDEADAAYKPIQRRRPDRWRIAPIVPPGASSGGGVGAGSGNGNGGHGNGGHGNGGHGNGNGVQGATTLLLNDIFGASSGVGLGGSIDCITRGRDGTF